ncbi:protein ALWAYS EARLY 2-like isoform X1 [Triticum dicoccoides]|uniref:protein ALWAYS EARLY 2-like isoform X1 n=1 Tax=Triticum dicoccoides TaxID=85692 RepID=UPI000E7A9747|nr:protein ALWAYS EARLY 2-like isoform X1 [Triticum dicoccoides]XP_037431929.1 protein ALWAYS EARLY 2-like isoform X1 [Triticum dicoccoides]XP_037431930.1 protein ALWAYS EARLY 2-like isoform X1 [Triticum dicoccoides]
MSSTRKVRNVNKRYAKINEDWPEKDATVVHKNKVRKKKLSDLGSQWSKDELERFYAAYRKYGKDWRKVAGAVHDRTSDMVEALYNMNRAYLSLPEGTATAAGLIAMMTDHYNILDGSNSDHESNGSPKTSRKPQKRGRAKLQSVSKASDTRYPDLLQSQPASSSYGCLSLLKKKRSGDLFVGNKPRAVGKRTPRVPVASMYRDDKIGPSNRQAKPDANNGDEEGALAALALAEVCQRGSPQVSQTSGRSSGQMFLSPGKSIDRKNADSEMGSSKMHGFQVDADYPEGSLGSREAETGDYPKDASYFLNNEGSASGKSKPKVKRSQKRRKKAAHKTDDQFEDDREACSGTEEGCSSRKAKDISDLDVFGSKGSWPSNKSNKRSRQLFFGDELSALDALHTLADISVNILQPSSIAESESSAQFKDGSKDNESDDKPSVPAAVSLFDKKDKPRKTKKIKRQSEIASNEVVTRKKARLSKDHHHDGSTSDVKQDDCKCGVKMEKKKRKSSTLKISKDEKNTLKDSEKTEASAEEGKVSSNKGRHTHVSPVSKQNKSKAQESSPAHADFGKEAMDTVDMTENAITQQSDSASKSKSRRKLGILKALAPESKPAEGADDSCDNVSYPVNNVAELKDKLSHCLSSRFLRRWCMSEWFYSAIDYPWFAKSEFVEYLNHVKLGHVPRLTRVEWGVIRSSLGKPRRLSKQFLQEEREKLSQYRESVRQHYAELQSGVREGLPTDLARPLAVGQRVIACHPKTRELHDGGVLTVDRSRCRVQFDRPELGVEFVMDIDCMPLHPLENFPESLRRQNIVNKYYSSFSEVKFEDRSKEYGGGGAPRFIPNGDAFDSIAQAKTTANEATVAAQQAMYGQPCTLSQIQEREADIRALAELSRALDKKEALLVELRHMNEEVSGKQKDGEIIRDLEHFRKQYAMVLVQLRDSNDHVASALLCLRQRNTFHGQPTQSYPNKSMENGGASNRTPDPSSNLFGYINQESGSQVMEIIETSRSKAKTMVDVAVQAMCKVSEGENAFAKIGEALDNLNLRGTGSGSSILGIRRIPPDSGQANSDNSATGRFDPAAATNNISSPRVLPNGSDSEAQFPSELISSCVATILMIQNCTEKQYHPAEVAHILDSALSRLQPCSSQNVPIFREIEMCMGIIKNQMLALIPTPSG